MGLLLLAEQERERPSKDGMTKPLFTDPARRKRAREMILQKRGGHGRSNRR